MPNFEVTVIPRKSFKDTHKVYITTYSGKNARKNAYRLAEEEIAWESCLRVIIWDNVTLDMVSTMDGEFASSEELENDMRGLRGYDNDGNYIGTVDNENGWTP